MRCIHGDFGPPQRRVRSASDLRLLLSQAPSNAVDWPTIQGGLELRETRRRPPPKNTPVCCSYTRERNPYTGRHFETHASGGVRGLNQCGGSLPPVRPLLNLRVTVQDGLERSWRRKHPAPRQPDGVELAGPAPSVWIPGRTKLGAARHLFHGAVPRSAQVAGPARPFMRKRPSGGGVKLSEASMGRCRAGVLAFSSFGLRPARNAGSRKAGRGTCCVRSGSSTRCNTESFETGVWFLEGARAHRPKPECPRKVGSGEATAVPRRGGGTVSERHNALSGRSARPPGTCGRRL